MKKIMFLAILIAVALFVGKSDKQSDKEADVPKKQESSLIKVDSGLKAIIPPIVIRPPGKGSRRSPEILTHNYA